MIALRLGLVALMLTVGWPGAQDASAPTLPVVPDIILTGRVTDAASGAPLRSARVSVEGGNRGAMTNAQGV